MAALQTIAAGQTGVVSGAIVGTVTLGAAATLEVLAGTEASLFGGLSAPAAAAIRVDAGAVLFAPATTPANVSVALLGVGSELVLAASTLADFTASLTGLPPGALIDITGAEITSVTTTDVGSGVYALVLDSALGVVGTIEMATVPPSLVLGVPDGIDGTLLLSGTAPPPPAIAAASATAPADTFTWIGGAGQNWGSPAPWSVHGSAALRSPGAQDTVSIIGGPSILTALAGAGNCATLSTGEAVAFAGPLSTTAATIGVTASDVLVLMPGADMTATRVLLRAGIVSVQSATLSVAGTLTVSGLLEGKSGSMISAGTLLLAGGTLRLSADTGMLVGTDSGLASGALTIAPDGTLVGTGTIKADVALSGALEVTTGTLSVLGVISGAGTILLDAGATLFASGGLGTATIAFGSGSGTTLETFATLSGALVTGFSQGVKLEIAGATPGTLTWTPDDTGGILDLGTYGAITVHLAADLDPQHAHFVEAADGLGGIFITALPCFVAATLLQTPDGWIRAGDVTPGTWLCTAAGAARRAVWIGRTDVAGWRRSLAPYLDPVHLQADALGPGRPGADLMLSPLHGILLDTAAGPRIVPAVLLCDGRRITRDRSGVRIQYVHIALDRHDTLMVAGLACESFLPHGPDPRAQFERSAGPRPPRSSPLAARLEHGPLLLDLRRRLGLQMAVPENQISRARIDINRRTTNGQSLEGWVEGATEIEVVVEGQTVWRGYRNGWRADLEAAGINGGHAGFVATIPPPGPQARVSMRARS